MAELKGLGDRISLLQPFHNGFQVKTGEFTVAAPLEHRAGHGKPEGAFTSRTVMGVNAGHASQTKMVQTREVER
jgi:hypothetical protein